MSDYESLREDAKRDRYYDSLPDAPECPSCGKNMDFTGAFVYGDDADGRRGVPLREWQCQDCGYAVEEIKGGR